MLAFHKRLIGLNSLFLDKISRTVDIIDNKLLLQNTLRNQNNKSNYNLVSETLMFLDCICGSTTGGLGLLGLYINEYNVTLINQTLETLTEYCQGPCHDNQVSRRYSYCKKCRKVRVIKHITIPVILKKYSYLTPVVSNFFKL